MTREEFIARNNPRWIEFEGLLHALKHRKAPRPKRMDLSQEPPDLSRFDSLYRMVCAHLALARQRQYGTDLESKLNGMALRAYTHLYGKREGLWRGLRDVLLRKFPEAVSELSVMVLIAALVFVLPLLGLLIGVISDPGFVGSLLDPEAQQSIEKMYDPASEHFARERASDGNLAMFGFYIFNNIGLAFRTYAGGLLAGIGSLVVLLFNGAFIGATMGHLTTLGYGETFFPFVAGHSAFELTAIVLAGAAGLDLGWSLLSPGSVSRADALRRAGRRSAMVVGGVFALLVLAAFVEAYWSPLRMVPAWVKYCVGLFNWLLVIGWLLRGRRKNGS
jgi:uncharacterized membrane protein SpoIIM required for sporulation